MGVEVGGSINVNASFSGLATRSLLAAALTTDQIFETTVLRLYIAGPDPSPDMTLGDFTLAGFSGYAQVTGVAFGTPYLEDNRAVMQSLSADNVFGGTDGATIQSVAGWLLTDGATSTANVLYAEPLDAPVEMGAANSSLTIIPRIAISASQG